MSNNYDPIARYYDFLHHLFFGQSEVNAQVELLDYVRTGDHLLIAGGGTGWILDKIPALYPAGLRITYVESSAKMMEMSKARNCRQNVVTFITADVAEWAAGAAGGQFDCILTGFFFDNFTEEQSERIVGLLTPLLKDRGYWLFTDFYYPKKRGKLWQAILLKTMYISARLICRVEAKRLPDMDRILPAAGYRALFTSYHYQRFIRSVVYQKMR